jgi:hypothetical protein
MRSVESQEEATDPLTDGGGNARGEHRRTTNGGWPLLEAMDVIELIEPFPPMQSLRKPV